jgi:hypothetical protein
MATQLDAIVETRAPLSGWREYHIFYHADQNCLLRQLVTPLTRELLDARVIDRFFFVRYELGGPHLRLRWRLISGTAEDAAEAVLADLAEQFFAAWPSTSPFPDERIRALNRALAGTPSEADMVYPDNSWVAFPVRFEIDRYGGIDGLCDSLDLFHLSSVQVLRMLAGHADTGTGWTRTAMLHLTLRLALGFADNEDELLTLAGYGERFMGPRFAACAKRADEFFARKQQELAALVRREFENTTADELTACTYRLVKRLADLPDDARWYAAASHIHMTANRLGLTNAEEVYLSRMLFLALQAFRQEAPRHQWRTLADEG